MLVIPQERLLPHRDHSEQGGTGHGVDGGTVAKRDYRLLPAHGHQQFTGHLVPSQQDG